MQTKLTLSKITMLPTMLFEHYITQLNKCDEMQTYLAKYNRNFTFSPRWKSERRNSTLNIPHFYYYVYVHLRKKSNLFAKP